MEQNEQTLESISEIRYLAIGTYERKLLGVRVLYDESSNDYLLMRSFVSLAHDNNSVAVVSCSNQYVATGSADETIKVFDLARQVEDGTILEHSGTISGLGFIHSNPKSSTPSHMISIGEDGKIGLYSTNDWELVSDLSLGKRAGIRKVPLLAMAVHPSGKVFLTTDAKGYLTCWDVMTGRPAYVRKLPGNDAYTWIEWSGDGVCYAVANEKQYLFMEDTKKMVYSREADKYNSYSAFTTLYGSVMAVGKVSGEVSIFDAEKSLDFGSQPLYDKRVNTLNSFMHNGNCFVIASNSKGVVQMYKLHPKLEEKDEDTPLLTLCAEVSLHARITCISTSVLNADVAPPKSKPKKKKKHLPAVSKISKEKELKKKNKMKKVYYV